MSRRLARTSMALLCPHLVHSGARLDTVHVSAELRGGISFHCEQDEDSTTTPVALPLGEAARLCPEVRAEKLLLLGMPPYAVYREEGGGWSVVLKDGWKRCQGLPAGRSYDWSSFRPWARQFQLRWQDQAVADVIREQGWKVIHVFTPPAQGDDPPFAYTIGLKESLAAPEVLLIGLAGDIAVAILNELGRQIRERGPLPLATPLWGLVEGFPLMLVPTMEDLARRYATRAYGYYARVRREVPPPVLQLVWPDKAGHWPWQRGATATYWAGQPILSVPPGIAPEPPTPANA